MKLRGAGYFEVSSHLWNGLFVCLIEHQFINESMVVMAYNKSK